MPASTLILIAALAATPPDECPAEKYVTRDVEGWQLHIHPKVAENADLLEPVLKEIGVQLHLVKLRVPPGPLGEMQKVPIWVEDMPGRTAGQYHPSRDWLAKNGYLPVKAKAVEIQATAKLADVKRRQMNTMMHELCHAYHDRVLGFELQEIRDAHARAVAGGKYDSVLFHDGKKVRHYALTNKTEFFAELSETYFGFNDFFPFVRAELKEFDPQSYELLERIWSK